MSTCPVCESYRIVIVVAPRRGAFCTSCRARWIQEGSLQRKVIPAIRGERNIASVTIDPPAKRRTAADTSRKALIS